MLRTRQHRDTVPLAAISASSDELRRAQIAGASSLSFGLRENSELSDQI